MDCAKGTGKGTEKPQDVAYFQMSSWYKTP